jgi:hypothetical protein
MRLLKTSWEKEKKKEIPIEVMNHIATRGSLVIVKSKRMYNDINGTLTSPDTGLRELSFADQLNDRIKSINFSLWMENIADNIVSIRKNEDISDIPKGSGKSAIIVGAGPSFRDTISHDWSV